MSTFKMSQFRKLTPAQQLAIQQAVFTLNGNYDETHISKHWDDERITEALDLVGPSDGCVPDGYTENLDQNIIKKFRGVYGAARTLAEGELRTANILCTVQPCTEDSTYVIIHEGDHIYYIADRKAWHVSYDSLEKLADHILEVKQAILKNWHRLNATKLHLITENDGGTEDPVFATFDAAKAKAKYFETIKGGCQKADKKDIAKVTKYTDDEGIERAEYGDQEYVKVDGVWYELMDGYGDKIVRSHELDVE